MTLQCEPCVMLASTVEKACMNYSDDHRALGTSWFADKYQCASLLTEKCEIISARGQQEKTELHLIVQGQNKNDQSLNLWCFALANVCTHPIGQL